VSDGSANPKELRRDVMAKEIGSLKLSVQPEALRLAIESGRLFGAGGHRRS